MATMELGGKQCEVDEDGYLLNLDDWNEDVAKDLAKTDEVELNDEQWEIINFLREYFAKYQIAPMIKILVKELKKSHGKEKGSTKYLYQLFPDGPAKQACRYAGLPKPTGCV